MLKYPKLAVRAIICNDNNEMLILKRSDTQSSLNLWCLPGGKVDYGKTVIHTLKKEIYEETSLQLHNTNFLMYQDNLPDEDNCQHYVTLYFICNVKGAIKLNNESSKYAWINQKDMDKFSIAFLNSEAMECYWDKYSKWKS